ncbi:MAG TPA: lysophospholipid acyltransferase family protein [Candidatus Paceibacterota bacterium]
MRSTNPIFLKSPLILQTAIWPATRFFFWFFMHLKVVGLENLKDLPKGVIFASNHTGELDPIIVPASLPFLSRFSPTFYVSRPREFYNNSGWRQIFYGGLFFKLWGSHSAISGYKDYGVSLSNHIHIIQRRHSLIIYPEGLTTKTGEVMVDEAHGGVAFLAEKTGLPIVPVYIGGHYKITLKDYLLRRRHVSIVFGRPIYSKELFGNEILVGNRYKSAARKVLGEVAALGKKLKNLSESEYKTVS